MKHLLDLLKTKSNIDEFLVTEVKTTSKELFFIKDELQMNRAKDTHYYYVDVFKNFEEDGKKYKGSSETKLAPNMTLEEMSQKLDIASLAASFVKNEYYDLPNNVSETLPETKSKFLDGDILEDISQLVSDLYSENTHKLAFINSAEFFINIKERRLVNSNGLDVSFKTVDGEIELITEAHGEKESIELFEVLHFSDYNQAQIKESIQNELHYASLRANAVPMPTVKDLPVILQGGSSFELFDYYDFQASAAAKYQHFHKNELGTDLQPETNGDKVSITLKPYIENSTRNRYVDGDGVFLKDTPVVKDGKLVNFIASKRFADYLNITPSGTIGNRVIDGGKKQAEELKTGPYLELIKFSDFQMDSITGDFGGEFRLGIYFDGEKEIPVTLGSVSANIKEAQKDMYLSNETTQVDNVVVPKFIRFEKMSLAGN